MWTQLERRMHVNAAKRVGAGCCQHEANDQAGGMEQQGVAGKWQSYRLVLCAKAACSAYLSVRCRQCVPGRQANCCQVIDFVPVNSDIVSCEDALGPFCNCGRRPFVPNEAADG